MGGKKSQELRGWDFRSGVLGSGLGIQGAGLTLLNNRDSP